MKKLKLVSLKFYGQSRQLNWKHFLFLKSEGQRAELISVWQKSNKTKVIKELYHTGNLVIDRVYLEFALAVAFYFLENWEITLLLVVSTSNLLCCTQIFFSYDYCAWILRAIILVCHAHPYFMDCDKVFESFTSTVKFS